jgi:hypothetical protein
MFLPLNIMHSFFIQERVPNCCTAPKTTINCTSIVISKDQLLLGGHMIHMEAKYINGLKGPAAVGTINCNQHNAFRCRRQNTKMSFKRMVLLTEDPAKTSPVSFLFPATTTHPITLTQHSLKRYFSITHLTVLLNNHMA